jgi:hypothetical protein
VLATFRRHGFESAAVIGDVVANTSDSARLLVR